MVFGGRRVIGFTMAGYIESCVLDLEQTLELLPSRSELSP